jgi:hypothetical protein
MQDEMKIETAAAALQDINQAWLAGRSEDLEPLLHPDIVMVFPGFQGSVQGRDVLLAGFRDFCDNARVHEYREHDHQSSVVGDTAVVSLRFEMVYERSGQRWRSTGRDLWVLRYASKLWIAVWRTMLDIEETAV